MFLQGLHLLSLSCLLAYASAQTPPFALFRTFSDPNCQNETQAIVLEPSAGAAPGCIQGTFDTFDSIILDQQEGCTEVDICERGFSCDQAQSNIISNVGECQSNDGGSAQFDKVQICF
jgi:hypothetical protein